MNDKELKACPFCGYSAILSEIPTGADSHYLYFVECSKCPATIDMESTRDKIINAWNTRHKPKQEEYRHCKFCKDNCSEYDVCDPYEDMSPATVIIKCDKKAKEVFAWLKENNYKIIKEQKDE